MRCPHRWQKLPNAGFNLKRCSVCSIYQGAVYIPHRKLLTHLNRKELESILTQLKTKHLTGTLGVAQQSHSKHLHVVLDGYLDEWIAHPGRKTATIQSQIRLFKKTIPDVSLKAINEPNDPAYNVIGAWVQKYLKVAKPVSVQRKFNTLRAALNWGISKGFLQYNPCRRIKLPKSSDPLPRYLDKEEIRRLFEASPRRKFTDYCSLVLSTGLRPNEALGLQVENIHFKARTIAGFVQKNKRKLGSIPLPKQVENLLKTLVGGRKHGSVLEYTPQMLRDDSERAIAEAGINDVIKPGTGKFTIYGLRHTFASEMLMAGESMTTVARWLRNSVTICDKYYGHLTQEYLREAGDRLKILPVTYQSPKIGLIGEKSPS